MTVAELIEKLQEFPPGATVVSFHDDAPPPMHQIQQIHTADYVNLGEHKWVVVQAKQITRGSLSTP